MADGRAARTPVQDLTADLYQTVIDNVMARVKPEFVQEGIDESVLDELRAIWEAKVAQTGVIGEPIRENISQILASVKPEHQLKHEGVAQRVQQQQQQQFQQFAAGYAPPGAAAVANALALQQQFLMAQAARSPGIAAQPLAAPGLDDSRKRKAEEEAGGAGAAPAAKLQQPGAVFGAIPQRDGPADDGAAAAGAGDGDAGVKSDGEALGEEDDDDAELKSDDDLADVDDKEVNEEEVADVMLGQFDKVHRSKARWRVSFRDCVLSINKRDYLLRKVTGEMHF